jgi:hypothetical protein
MQPASPITANAPSAPATVSTPAAPQSAQVAFRIAVPSSTTSTQSRNPAYVSTATQSASVTVAPAGGSAGAPTVVNCTTVGQGSVNAPIGNDTFTINLYSAQNAVGSILSTGSMSQAIVVATTNNVNVTFNGVPASIAVSGIPAGTLGTAFTTPQAFTVAVKDAAGNTIVGTYASPIHLTNSDPGGATNVVTSGSDTPPANTLLSSSDVAALNFTGASIVSATIGASASGARLVNCELLAGAATHGLEFDNRLDRHGRDRNPDRRFCTECDNTQRRKWAHR